jgi:AmmeMemoRadiSam system protein B
MPLLDGQHDLEAIEACLASLGVPRNERRDEANALVQSLAEAGFLEDANFWSLRERAHSSFQVAPVRRAAHAGSSYPESRAALDAELHRYHAHTSGNGVSASKRPPMAIIAPHVSPFGGVRGYVRAYQRLSPQLADSTFVILGTSHQGAPDRFGLTEKPFETPFGRTRAAPALVKELARASPSAVSLEDYQHAVEHSIEFQVVFLQHTLRRADIEVVPILCGAFLDSLISGRPPEDKDEVRAFFDALSELYAKQRDLVFVLGVDLAHVGRRYGDPRAARRLRGELLEVEAIERERLDALFRGQTERFLDLVTQEQDPLRWCGFSPLYTFAKAVPEARGNLLHYDQWNIDDDSVVSFAAAEYHTEPA